MYPALLSLGLAAIVSAAPGDSPAQPDITPAPKAEVNDGGGGLFGWYEWSNEWFSTNCPSGQEYGTYSNFGACCSKGGKYCTYATGCTGNNVLYIDGGVANCGEEQCDTATVFDYKGSPETNVHSAILCFPTSAFREVPRTFYRYPASSYSSFLGPGTSRQIVFGSTIPASDSGPTMPSQASSTSTGERSTAATESQSTASETGMASTTSAEESGSSSSESEASGAPSTTSGSEGQTSATGSSAQPSKSNAAAGGYGAVDGGVVWGISGVLALMMI